MNSPKRVSKGALGPHIRFRARSRRGSVGAGIKSTACKCTMFPDTGKIWACVQRRELGSLYTQGWESVDFQEDSTSNFSCSRRLHETNQVQEICGKSARSRASPPHELEIKIPFALTTLAGVSETP